MNADIPIASTAMSPENLFLCFLLSTHTLCGSCVSVENQRKALRSQFFVLGGDIEDHYDNSGPPIPFVPPEGPQECCVCLETDDRDMVYCTTVQCTEGIHVECLATMRASAAYGSNPNCPVCRVGRLPQVQLTLRQRASQAFEQNPNLEDLLINLGFTAVSMAWVTSVAYHIRARPDEFAPDAAAYFPNIPSPPNEEVSNGFADYEVPGRSDLSELTRYHAAEGMRIRHVANNPPPSWLWGRLLSASRELGRIIGISSEEEAETSLNRLVAREERVQFDYMNDIFSDAWGQPVIRSDRWEATGSARDSVSSSRLADWLCLPTAAQALANVRVFSVKTGMQLLPIVAAAAAQQTVVVSLERIAGLLSGAEADIFITGGEDMTCPGVNPFNGDLLAL